MFDQVMKRSNWVWIYKMGRFAEERRAFLCDLNEQGHSMQTLAACDPGGGNRRIKKRWRDDPSIMEFLHRL